MPAGQGGVPAFAPGEPGMPTVAAAQAPSREPARKPLTEAGLRGMGAAGVANEQIGGLDSAQKAGEALSDKEAYWDLQRAHAYEARNAENDRLIAAQAAEAQAKSNDIAKRQASYDAMVTKIANTKIDREDDHPIQSAIGMLIAGIGSAWKNESTNPALDLVQKQIERKVQGQMQDLDRLGKVAGMQKEGIDMIRQQASDSTARYNMMLAGENMKAAGQIEALGARSNNDTVRQRAAVNAAAFRQKAAELTGTAVMAQQGKDDRDKAFAEQQRHTKVEEKNQAQQTGIAYGHLSLAKKGLDEQIREHDIGRQDKLDELALGYAKLGAKDKADKAKEVATSGVFDPTSGNAVLTPEGQKITDQADALERASRKADPTKAQAMLAQAKNLRDQAEAVGGFTIADKDIRKEVIKKVGASQSLIDTIGQIKATLATDPSSIDRDTWAGLGTKMEEAKAAFIEAHGAKMSSKEMAAVEDMFGANPSDMATRVGGRGKMLARLNALEQGAISGTSTELRSNGYKGDWRPRALQTEEFPTLTGKTSVERGADAELGSVGKRLSFTTNESRMGKAENQGDITPTGLDAQSTNIVKQLARKYDDATTTDRAKIMTQLSAYASSDRPSLAQGVVTLLNAENPGLYKQVVAANPNAPHVAGDDNEQARQQVIASTPIATLRDSAIAGDSASKMEIARRAASGDRSAQLAAHEVIQKFQPSGAQIGVPR